MVGGDESDQATDETDPIMLDMIQTQTINLSKNLAADMLARMREVNKIKFARVQEAPLRVLKLPHIPSVLVETAYISNPVEEQLLKDPNFQKKLSSVIAASIVDFLSDPGTRPVLPPASAVIAEAEKPQVAAPGELSVEAGEGESSGADEKKRPALEEAAGQKSGVPDESVEPSGSIKPVKPAIKSATKQQIKFKTYIVKKGDSLERIARHNGTTMAELRRINNLKDGRPLLANAKLKDPRPTDSQDNDSSRESGAPRKKERTAPAFYIVKKGDTLDRIARRNSTSIAALLRLNSLKMKGPLYVGRRLRIADNTEPGEIKAQQSSAAVQKTLTKQKKAPQPSGDLGDTDEEAARETQASKVKTAVSFYTVKKGDTLEKIATRHKTSIAALVELNNMKMNSPLLAGRRLKIAADPQEIDAAGVKTKKTKTQKAVKGSEAKSQKVSVYVVRKGDTLERIARKNNSSISALLKLNGMKLEDNLPAGKRLKIPAK